MKNTQYSEYVYSDGDAGHHCEYLLPRIYDVLQSVKPCRLFDLGCGNGSVANYLSKQGYQVTGVDPSASGISIAKFNFPELTLDVGSCYDDLATRYGTFPVVISLEVVEHVYSPREYARCVYELVEDNGIALISTPFHGYWKNLALALSGKFDDHFTALWDHGHIKFWSRKTLSALLLEAGFRDVKFKTAGRIAPFAKSMLAIAKK